MLREDRVEETVECLQLSGNHIPHFAIHREDGEWSGNEVSIREASDEKITQLQITLDNLKRIRFLSFENTEGKMCM